MREGASGTNAFVFSRDTRFGMTKDTFLRPSIEGSDHPYGVWRALQALGTINRLPLRGLKFRPVVVRGSSELRGLVILKFRRKELWVMTRALACSKQ